MPQPNALPPTVAPVALPYFSALSHKRRDFRGGREVWGIPENKMCFDFNPVTPNDPYSGRIAPLTSKRCILYIYSTNI